MGSDRYQKAVQKIFDLQFFGIKLGLVNIRNLLKDLSDPQEAFKVVMVAGTNGKGSVASTLASICTESSIRCGLFTSPHLVRFNERFVVAEKQITDQRVLELSDHIWSLVDRRQQMEDPDGPSPITFFEFATAMACLYFKQEGCEIGIFECGLGGRLDATNALDPILDIFTPISYDHQQFLGETLNSIAGEKAGICRPGVPAIVSAQEEEARLSLFVKFQELEVPSWVQGRDFGIRRETGNATYWDPDGELAPVKTTLPGAYQLKNTSVAIAGARYLKRLGISITDEAILAGPLNVFWPGRLEKVSDEPAIILDGAHNPAAAKLLSKTLTEEPVAGRTIGIISIMSDKDFNEIIRQFDSAFDAIIATKSKMPRSLDQDKLAQVISHFCSEVYTSPDIGSALKKAGDLAGTDGRVIVCGSFFLVGEARSLILGDKGQGPNGEWIGIRG